MEISDRIGDHRIIENKKSNNATIQVDCLTLDEFFKFLNFDVNKGPMLGQCDINFYNSLQIDKKYMLME